MRGYWLRGGVAAIGVAAAVMGACSSETTVDGFTQDEWAQVQTLSPLPALAPDTTNKFADNPTAAALGQRLFFDKAFSGPVITAADGTNGGNGAVGDTGKIGCVNCHLPTLPSGAKGWMIDTRSNPNATSLGTQWMIRNAATPINSSFYKVWCEKDGVRDTQWSDSLTDPEDPTSMNGSRLQVAHVMYAKYKADYDALFSPPLDPDLDPASPNASRFPATGKPASDPTMPGPWEAMAPADQVIVDTIFANFGKAVQAYVRTLVSRNAPFDAYAAGNYSAISASAKNGLHLFLGKAGCIGCHSGPLFSDSKFHATGLAAQGAHVNVDETGRYDAVPAVLGCEFNSNSPYSDDKQSHRLDGVAQTDDLRGEWRTTQLRSVAETAPYMHTGQLATLKDAVHFYNLVGTTMQAPACPAGVLPSKSPTPCYIGTLDKLMVQINLSDSEEDDVVAFLQTLTGDPLPAALTTDTSRP